MRVLGIVSLVWVACSLTGAPARADDALLSTELRFGVFSWAARWSRRTPVEALDTGTQSLYVVPSIEARFYPRARHGATVGIDYRIDLDPTLCIFGPCPQVSVDFVVARAGYAYRIVRESRRKPTRRAWAFTPHASISAGAALSETNTESGAPIAGIADRSPVVGFLVGIDIDFHIKRFFFGWSVSYELLFHTKGAIQRSNFLYWNAFPLWRIGVVIGRPVQTPEE